MDCKTENGQGTPESGVESGVVVLQEESSLEGQGAARTLNPNGTRALQLLRGDAQQPIAEQVLSPDETDMAKMAQPAEPREVDAMGAV
jgi:hypothetical protein